MITGRGLPSCIIALATGCGFATAQVPGAGQSVGAEKPPLIATAREIQDRVQKIYESAGNSNLLAVTDQILRSAQWLGNAAERWNPEKAGEGVPLLNSLERMLGVLRHPPAGGMELESLLFAIGDDLSVKEEHCRQKGLTTPQRVFVVTKKNGTQEVKGLSVQYIEKFFQSEPSARPQEFRNFSSPSVDDLVPGSYVIWARETRRGRTERARKRRASATDFRRNRSRC